MKHIILFLCCLLLIVPVSSQTVIFTAPKDQAVWAIYITSPVSTSGTIELYQANGDTVTGSWSYVFGMPVSTFTETFEGDTASFTYVAPLPMQIGLWNGDNSTKSMRFIYMGFGNFKGLWNDVVKGEIKSAAIVGYRITADNTITVTPELKTTREIVQALNIDKEGLSGLPELLAGYAPLIVGVFTSLIYWLKFLFVDNLVVTVILYVTGTMAYAVNTSRNIFKFYEKWFKQQIALFNFIAGAFSTTFQIVTQVAAVIGSVVSSLASAAIIAARILLRI